MPRPTKLDRLRDERAAALAALNAAREAQRLAVAALPETAALAAAERALDAAYDALHREQESARRRAEIRSEYEVRTIDADGDASDCWHFDSREDAIREATRLHGRIPASHAVAVERLFNGNRSTVWRRGSAAALDAWEGNVTA